MRSAWIGLLILLAIAPVVLLPAFVEPTGSSGRTKSTQRPPRETKNTHAKSTKSRGVFSGSDSSDPRVYH
ncbi:MAG TPA: hypothetical protein VHC72_10775 [Bryobacteraceae bacterium]|nr:hypothetical protein [Bryobacteraceae bacterium]